MIKAAKNIAAANMTVFNDVKGYLIEKLIEMPTPERNEKLNLIKDKPSDMENVIEEPVTILVPKNDLLNYKDKIVNVIFIF